MQLDHLIIVQADVDVIDAKSHKKVKADQDADVSPISDKELPIKDLMSEMFVFSKESYT